VTIKPTKVGKEIEKNLSNVNMDPWYYIYENYIQNQTEEEQNQTEEEQDSSD
jgi:hypothetical protein